MMNEITIINPRTHNGIRYRIIEVVDIIANSQYDSHVLNYDELKFIKLQREVDLILFKFWVDIKVYKITEQCSIIQQLCKANALLNQIAE